MVSEVIKRMEVSHLLDYGCGAQCNLAKHLKLEKKLTYQAYDPCVEKYAKSPLPAQMVACVDVLEHIEPDCLDAVLDDLSRLTLAVAFLSVDTKAALKTLSDGRNAHLIQEDMRWWLPKIWARFDLQTVQYVSEHQFFVIALAKTQIEDTAGNPLAS